MTDTKTKTAVTKSTVKVNPTILCLGDSLVDIVFNQKSATFIGIRSNTECRMNKTNNPHYGKVRKIGYWGGMVCDIYENGVQRKADKEGLNVEFKAQELKWGHHWRGHKSIIEHKGSFYLQIRVENPIKTVYVWNDGKDTPLTKDEIAEIKEFFPPKREGASQPAEDKIVYRTVKVENITEFSMNGVRFVLNHK